MNDNENFEKEGKNAIVELEIVLMSIAIVSFLITIIFYFIQYHITYLINIFIIGDPLLIAEAVLFVHGLVVVLLGLLVDRLKKQESH